MTPIISTGQYDLYAAPIPTDEAATRHERERAAAVTLIRSVFGEDAGLDHTPEGAPVVTGTTRPAPVSLSHDTHSCLLAVSRDGRPVGVDIEQARAQLTRVCGRFLTDAEHHRFEHCDDRDKTTFLLRCWTAKEAVYKCALTPGLGLKEIELHPDGTAATARGIIYNIKHFRHGDDEIVAAASFSLPQTEL
ncbi:MAG: 4'-phosphopantetheinyl transferase superfamily protein [Staphylococcus sp.]|nr:4'-phosphopantetheinyl transferase superfamily protein [Staphylococcus sp.]